ncbi:hypothetical protein CH063_15556, partial [Colletotrichum higginsianum]
EALRQPVQPQETRQGETRAQGHDALRQEAERPLLQQQAPREILQAMSTSSGRRRLRRQARRANVACAWRYWVPLRRHRGSR